MKGRNRFLPSEANRIREILHEKADSDNQKTCRRKLRRLGFFISDFGNWPNGFTAQDFDKLIRTQRVIIIDSIGRPEQQNAVNAGVNRTSNASLHIESFAPIISQGAQVLILGTMPGPKSLLVNQYYANPTNKFWEILETIFRIDFKDTYEHRIAQLQSKHIALWDVLASCERIGASDKDIKNEQPNDFTVLLTNHPNIKAILFNGQDARKYYEKLVVPKLDKTISTQSLLTLPSSSRAYAKHISIKVHDWREQIAKYVELA